MRETHPALPLFPPKARTEWSILARWQVPSAVYDANGRLFDRGELLLTLYTRESIRPGEPSLVEGMLQWRDEEAGVRIRTLGESDDLGSIPPPVVEIGRERWLFGKASRSALRRAKRAPEPLPAIAWDEDARELSALRAA